MFTLSSAFTAQPKQVLQGRLTKAFQSVELQKNSSFRLLLYRSWKLRVEERECKSGCRETHRFSNLGKSKHETSPTSDSALNPKPKP